MDSREDRDAWLERAMEQYEESLLRMCFACLNDAALAEDAVQETFLKAYRALDRFRGDAEEKTWLLRIAINTCRDLRRSAWFRHVDRKVTLDGLGEPASAQEWSEWDDTLTRAVMGLKPKYREAVLLCCYQCLTGQEAASVLKISRSAVMNRLRQAKAILRKELEVWYHGE
ncbi:MAG: sigma-70 family RNA polymerase sigma factor [Candidatus Limiplasma sp.]|nr:sigma-70 family RNA polymerase sigma factor [Clostridiales bacterium]MDY4063838.1 sigma-70 family RNA polymerase sigma factor [Candidatus Limiplasma sp.]